jgi:DNA-binding MarR family transcriptional regulator
VTSAVDRLERQGFVRRRPHPTDGRTTLAELTDEGREVAARATKALNEQVFAAPGLAVEQLNSLFDVLRDLRRQAGDF